MGEPAAARAGRRGALMPLFVETLLLTFASYLVGLALAWLLFGRPRKDSYL